MYAIVIKDGGYVDCYVQDKYGFTDCIGNAQKFDSVDKVKDFMEAPEWAGRKYEIVEVKND